MNFFICLLAIWPLPVVTQNSATGPDIVIGGTNSATGKYHVSGYAEQIRDGWNMWRDKVNAQGGLNVGGVRRKIAEFLFKDDESSSTVVVTRLEEALKEFPLDFIIGPPSSGLNAPAGKVASDAKKIMFSHGASESIYNKGYGYVFSTLSPAGSYMSSALEDFRNKVPPAETVYLMWKEDNAFALATCIGAKAKAEELGYTILGTHAYEASKENFGKKAREIKKFKIKTGKSLDVLVSCGHKAEAKHVTTYLASLDVNVKAVVMSFATDTGYIEGVSQNRALGVISPTQWTPTMVDADDGFFGNGMDFYRAFETKFGKKPAYQNAYSAANAYCLGKAIEAAGTIETEAVRQALYDMKIDTFYGTIDFSDASHPSGLLGAQPDRKMAALQIQKKTTPSGDVVVSHEDYAPLHSTKQVYPLPTWFERLLVMHPCREGQQEDSGECVDCPLGAYRDSTQLVCTDCGPGEYADVKALASCKKCPSGTHSKSLYGSAECTGCAAGRANSQEGQPSCVPCPMGQYAVGTENLECSVCPKGSFSDETESSSCKSCVDEAVELTTTALIGSTNKELCECPEGRYMSKNEKCELCPKGMTCNFGTSEEFKPDSIFPVVKAGFMTIAKDPMLVYQCIHEDFCLAGSCSSSACEAGQCAANRDASVPACGKCEDGSYIDGSVCTKCTGGDALPLVVVFIAAFILLVVLTVVINRDMSRQTNWAVGISVSLTCIFMAIQTTTVYLNISLEWVEPGKTLLNALSIAAFDLSTVKADCVMSPDPVARHLTRQLIPMIFAVYVCAVLVVKKNMVKSTDLHAEVSNTVGTLFMIFFVSICISVFDPFVCYEHPAKTLSSMRSSPSILCFEDAAHTSMIVISIISFLLVPLPFVVVSLRATMFFTTNMDANSVQFLRSFRFLFFRLRSTRYYFGVMLLARSLLLTLVPIVIRNDPAAQIMALVAILLTFVCLHSFFQPWKNALANRLDSVMSTCILMFLVCGAVGGGYKADQSTVTVLSWIVVVVFSGTWICLLFYNAWKHITPSDRYAFAVCCDAKQTPAQGRYLKLLLQKQNKKVFLNVDSNMDFDVVLDTVKLKTEHFVLYLGEGSLKSASVVGQIVAVYKTWLVADPVVAMVRDMSRFKMGRRNSVNQSIMGKVRQNISVVCTPSFSTPTNAELEQFATYMQAGGARTLVDFGVDRNDIRDAVSAILGKMNPIIKYIAIDESKNKKMAFDEISCSLVGGPLQKTDDVQIRDPLNCILMLANTQDFEAYSAAHILGKVLSHVMPLPVAAVPVVREVSVVGGIEELQAIGSQKLERMKIAIILLSAGSQMNANQIRGMGHLDINGPDVLVSVCLSGFTIPLLDKYISETLPKICSEVHGPRIRKLLESLDCEFLPSSSDFELVVQARKIMSKFGKRERSHQDATSPEMMGQKDVKRQMV